MKGWIPMSADITTAFLQGVDLTRELYINPPPEANEPKGTVWRLKRAGYGLGDAGERFWARVREVAIGPLGMIPSRVDPCVFLKYKGGEVEGMMSTHVDDFYILGEKSFCKHVKTVLPKHLTVKSWEGGEPGADFYYSGMRIMHHQDGTITMDLCRYIDAIQTIDIPEKDMSDKDRKLTEKEITRLRKAIGETLWVTTQTRPAEMYRASELAGATSDPRVRHLLKANEVIRRLKEDNQPLTFRPIGDDNAIRIYSDAAWGNREGGGSQGGGITCIADRSGHFNPLGWFSRRLRRVVRSTFGGETLACLDATDEGVCTALLWDELMGNAKWDPETHSHTSIRPRIPVHYLTDCRSLYDHLLHRGSHTLEKRLTIDMEILREYLDSRTIACVHWVPTEVQLADALTKRMTPLYMIRCLSSGIIPPWTSGRMFRRLKSGLIEDIQIKDGLNSSHLPLK